MYINLQNKLHKNYKRQGNYVKVGRHLKKTFINTKCKLISQAIISTSFKFENVTTSDQNVSKNVTFQSSQWIKCEREILSPI